MLSVLTSPLTRAHDTARIFLQFFKEQTGIRLVAEIEPDLQEISFGQYDGFALEEIDDEDFAKLVIRYRTIQDATIDWQGTGESFVGAAIRGRRLLEKFNAEFDGKIVVAFTHGTFISALRTVLGDKALLRDNGMVAFRDRILEHAEPLWLGQSQERIRALLSNLETGKRPMTNSRSKE